MTKRERNNYFLIATFIVTWALCFYLDHIDYNFFISFLFFIVGAGCLIVFASPFIAYLESNKDPKDKYENDPW